MGRGHGANYLTDKPKLIASDGGSKACHSLVFGIPRANNLIELHPVEEQKQETEKQRDEETNSRLLSINREDGQNSPGSHTVAA